MNNTRSTVGKDFKMVISGAAERREKAVLSTSHDFGSFKSVMNSIRKNHPIDFLSLNSKTEAVEAARPNEIAVSNILSSVEMKARPKLMSAQDARNRKKNSLIIKTVMAMRAVNMRKDISELLGNNKNLPNPSSLKKLNPSFIEPMKIINSFSPNHIFKTQRELCCHSNSIVEILNSKSRLITVSLDKTAKLLTSSGTSFGHSLTFEARPSAASSSGTGQFAISCLETVKIFTTRDISESISATSCIHQIALGKNEITFATDDKEVEIFDLEKMKKINSINFPHMIERIALEGPLTYLADSRAGIYALDKRTKVMRSILEPSIGKTTGIVPIGNSLVLTTEPGDLKIVDFRVNAFVIDKSIDMKIINSVAMGEKGIVALNDNINYVNLEDLSVQTHAVGKGSIRAAVVVEKKLYTGGFDGKLNCFEIRSEKL